MTEWFEREGLDWTVWDWARDNEEEIDREELENDLKQIQAMNGFRSLFGGD